jgi:hypothetical protein
MPELKRQLDQERAARQQAERDLEALKRSVQHWTVLLRFVGLLLGVFVLVSLACAAYV